MIFRGTTSECFEHFKSQYPGVGYKRNIRENQRAIAEFTQVGRPTVCRWYTKGFAAVGASLIRVRCMLDLLGYEVIEFKETPEPIRQLSRLVAYQLSTIDDIVEVFDFGGTPSGARDQAMSTLIGTRGLSDARLAQVKSYVDQYEEVIEKARVDRLESLRKQLVPVRPQPATAVQRADPPPVKQIDRPVAAPAAPISRDARAAIIESAAHQVLALRPLAELLLSDEFTPAERARLRDLAGGTGVFRLSNCLNGLCGERMREQQIGQQQANRIRGR